MSQASPQDEQRLRRRVKAELRKRMRALRSIAPAEACAMRSVHIVTRLAEHPVLLAAKSVALFWPLQERHEVDLRPLDRLLRARNVRVAYPTLVDNTPVMRFAEVKNTNDLCERGHRFFEPPPECPDSGPLDVIVVPAVAADPAGYRIGYGIGSYDRTLPRYAPPAITMTVLYDYQIVPEIPWAPHDIAVSWVVTDQRVFCVAGDRCPSSSSPQS